LATASRGVLKGFGSSVRPRTRLKKKKRPGRKKARRLLGKRFMAGMG
jgi:hypothetical protein